MTDGSLYTFWFLNHRLERDELGRQLRALQSRGFDGVFPHPRPGLLTPYLSREWFDCIRFIADECDRIGLEFWLYDEDPYPSGVCGGKVTMDHEEFHARCLHFEERELTSDGGEAEVALPTGELLETFVLQLADNGAISTWWDVSADCGVLRSTWSAPSYDNRGYYPPYSSQGREHWRTAAVDNYWMLRTELPPGKFQICAVYCARQADRKWGAYVDCMNADATATFIRETHDRYRAELGDERFARVLGIFTDEAKVVGEFPWTRRLPEVHAASFGEDLTLLLPHLRYELDEHTAAIRHRYRRTVGKMFREAFVKPIAAWCEATGIALTGHFSPEEDPIGQQMGIPDMMEFLGDMQLPGVDLIASNIGTRDFCILNLGPKTVASVAAQTGRSQVLSESLGVSGEDLDLARMKSMLEWQLVLGVNKFVLHGQFYSIDGPRKREAPPSIFETAPYWPLFDVFSGHVRFLCEQLRRGRRVCRIGVLYPMTPINVHLPERGAAELTGFRQHLGELTYRLLTAGLDHDWVSEQALVRSRCVDGTLQIGEADYDVLVVPNAGLLDDEVVERLAELDLPLLFADERAVGLVSGKPAVGGDVVASDALCEGLSALVDRPLRASLPGELIVQTREADGQRFHFVYNIEDVTYDGGLEVCSGEWLSEIRSGTEAAALTADADGVPHLLLPPLSGVLLAEIAKPAAVSAAFWQELPVGGPWVLRATAPNVFPLDRWTCADGRVCRLPHEGWSLCTVQPVLLETTFVLEAMPARCDLVWELSTFAREADIRINGHPVPQPERRRVYDVWNLVADIAGLLQKGENEVAVRIEGGADTLPPMLDPLRLFGEFGVFRRGGEWTIGDVVGPRNDATAKSWTELGYPFYSGTLAYELELDLGAPVVSDARLAIHGLHDAARVWVNDQDAGVVAWEPFECCVGRLLLAGKNRLRLEVANSFVNFVESEPRLSGITDGVKLRVPG